MNLQAIKKNCLNTMRFQIFNTPGGDQWLGDTGRGGSGTLLMIPQRAMKPLKKKDDYRRFYLREYDGMAAVAVYDDLLCEALIMPISPAGTELIMAVAARTAALPIWQREADGADGAEASAARFAEVMAE